MLYDKQKKPLDNEKYLQLMFRLIWWGSNLSVDREVNNGRGPVDYKISMGAKDSTLVEFKLAKNPQLKRNLLNQVEVYAKAIKLSKSKSDFFFSNEEKWRMNKILRETNLQGSDDVVVIDASPKVSASNDNTLFNALYGVSTLEPKGLNDQVGIVINYINGIGKNKVYPNDLELEECANLFDYKESFKKF